MHHVARRARVLRGNVARTDALRNVAYVHVRCISRSAFTAQEAQAAPAPETSSIAASVSGTAHCAPFARRTHTCGGLTVSDAGSEVVLMGWLLPERKTNKKLSFVSLRDSFGSVQLVVSGKENPGVLANLREVTVESTVLVNGTVRLRPEGQRRPVPSGDVEVILNSFTVLNPADKALPFMPLDSRNLANEELRLRYRYLDLRRTTLSENLRKRSEVARLMRDVFYEEGFTEVETPMLLKSTPEGAREFLVPTRFASTAASNSSATPTEPLFYALPQSPQQPKQLLVVSGAVDRYYQLARCFRDEDGRKDRQPEFTQVDLEIAWVSWGEHDASASPDAWRIGGVEVRDVVEKLMRRVWDRVEGVQLLPFAVMTYEEAIGKFGSDKPDLRFGMEIRDITEFLPPAAQSALAESGYIIEALVISKAGEDSAPFLRASHNVQEPKDGTIERIDVAEGASSWLSQSRLVPGASEPNSLTALTAELGLQAGGTVWLMKRPRRPDGAGTTALGRLRLALSAAAQNLGDLVLPTDPQFLWVTEFPLFTRADADKEFLAHGRRSSTHHPFTAPMWQDIEKMYTGEFDEVRGQHYDLVLNGVEVGGGSVRVHDAAMQEFIFANVLQLDEREKASFDHLLHALKCGAPPHGGFAFGFDRLMSILCKTESIRDVIAFPKTGAGIDLLFKSPASVSLDVLEQYGLRQKFSV